MPNINEVSQAKESIIQIVRKENFLGRILLYIFFFVLAISLATGGYYFGLKQGLKTKTAASPPKLQTQQQNIFPGLQQAQQYIEDYPELISKTSIVQTFTGKLKAIEPDKSWTIERKGKSIKVTKEGQERIRYLKMTKEQGSQSETFDPNEIKVGDNVSISISLDPQTIRFTINTIVLFTEITSEPQPSP